MSVTADTLRTHLRYTEWASKRLVEAATKLTEEELNRDFKHADKSVLGTLVHVFAADRVWISRVKGNVPARFIDIEKDGHLSVLQSEWPKVLAEWHDYAAGLTDEGVGEVAHYKDMKGNAHATPLWQIILHVVNHGTHHRGQVSAMMRSMGHSPLPLDLIAYYRELAT